MLEHLFDFKTPTNVPPDVCCYLARMGLAQDLDYSHPPPNPLQRAVQAFASTRVGAWVFAKSLPAMDRVVSRLTQGRTSLPRVLAGLPVLMVTTTGRKSGQRRETYLISVPIDDSLALLGTNFGQSNTPAWVLNLEADPRLSVTHRGLTREAVARPASDAERDQVMANSAGVYGGYVKYLQRIAGRRVRIFVLEPVHHP